MKHLFILLFLSFTSIILFTNATKSVAKDLPIVDVKKWLMTHMDELQSSCEVFGKVVENRSKPEIEFAYINLRNTFKKVEPILAFVDGELYSLNLNGAPLPKLEKKVPEQIVLEPKGLQRIEELVYEDELNRDELLTIANKFLKDITEITQSRGVQSITDPELFQAMRLGVLRINTMGITGFDTPVDANKSLKESAITLDGISELVELYMGFIEASNFSLFNTTISDASILLSTAKFDDFNRAEYLKSYGEQLWNQLLSIQQELYIELPTLKSSDVLPINYEAKSMFSDAFLNKSYFSDRIDSDKYDVQLALGKLLFFDPILSSNNERACASCHQPNHAFAENLETSVLMDKSHGPRNSPTLINALYAEKFFHDLRVDRLSLQVDHVVLNPGELGTDYNEIIEKLGLSNEYVALFKNAYPVQGISKHTITNALSTFVGSLTSYNSEFDQYMRGEKQKINQDIIAGFNLFSGKAACATCHFTPTFAGLVPPGYMESESEVLGVFEKNSEPYELDDDLGRYSNHILKEQVNFYQSSFKTPTLRNIELTAPYMHNGVFETLEDVVDFYNNGGGIGHGLVVLNQTLPSDSLKLNEEEVQQLVLFMKSLTDTTGMNTTPKQLPVITGNSALNSRQIGGVY